MNRTFARFYDSFMEPLEKKYIMKWRKELLLNAKGKVLEIGAGTGINFPLYQDCEDVYAIEPNPFMIEKAEKQKRVSRIPISIIESRAEQLPFPDEHFDTIVVTLVLCSVDEPKKALEEMVRVLKPNGKVLFLEHVEMDHPIFTKLQNLITPLWKRICDGCHLNRNTEKVIRNSGLQILSKQSHLSGFALSLVTKKK